MNIPTPENGFGDSALPASIGLVFWYVDDGFSISSKVAAFYPQGGEKYINKTQIQEDIQTASVRDGFFFFVSPLQLFSQHQNKMRKNQNLTNGIIISVYQTTLSYSSGTDLNTLKSY